MSGEAQAEHFDPEAQATIEVLRGWRRDCPICFQNWLAKKAAPNLTAQEKLALKEILTEGNQGSKRIKGVFWDYPLVNRILGTAKAE